MLLSCSVSGLERFFTRYILFTIVTYLQQSVYHSMNLLCHLDEKSSVAFLISTCCRLSPSSSLEEEQMLRKKAELESAQCRLQLQVLTEECTKLHSHVQVSLPSLIQRTFGVGIKKASKYYLVSSQIRIGFTRFFRKQTWSALCFWLGLIYMLYDEFYCSVNS